MEYGKGSTPARAPLIRRVADGLAWRSSARWRALPDFLIIGAQKAGTTSLYEELCTSDEILPARKKEVRFFDRHWERGTTWYRWSFPTRRALRAGPGARITGEATPDYLLHPLAPARAASVLPTCRLIVLLRHPVDRAHSQYRMNLALGTEERTFEAAIEDELTRLEARRVDDAEWDDRRNYHSYVERGRYHDQLVRWLQRYPRSSLHVTTLESILRSPDRELGDICRFLGVHDHRLTAGFAHSNRRRYDDLPRSTRAELFSLFADDLARTEALLEQGFGYGPESTPPRCCSR